MKTAFEMFQDWRWARSLRDWPKDAPEGLADYSHAEARELMKLGEWSQRSSRAKLGGDLGVHLDKARQREAAEFQATMELGCALKRMRERFESEPEFWDQCVKMSPDSDRETLEFALQLASRTLQPLDAPLGG